MLFSTFFPRIPYCSAIFLFQTDEDNFSRLYQSGNIPNRTAAFPLHVRNGTQKTPPSEALPPHTACLPRNPPQTGHVHKLFSDALIVIILRNPVGIPVSVGIVFILLRIQVKLPLIDLLLLYSDLLQLFFYKLLRHPCRDRLQSLFFIVIYRLSAKDTNAS